MGEPDDWMTTLAEALPKLIQQKKKLLAMGLTIAKCRCVWCGEPGMVIGVAGPRNHLRASCAACNRSMME